MPVTFHPAPHKANPVWDVGDMNARELLRTSCPEQWDICDKVLGSFIGLGDSALCTGLTSAHWGLVSTITDAYNHHHALVLRPDDVWLAILVQFNFYVNAHAEELRQHFVAHEGKKEIVVSSDDITLLPVRMTDEMEKHIVDPDLRQWILPNFSTTTSTDTVVAAVLMMATLKAYFSYTMHMTCGIPRVTLEGEKADWEQILYKAKKLREYGSEPAAWYKLLEPVLTRFVRAFDAPDAQENLDFWQKVVNYRNGGSGPTYLSGWITAFCAFGSEGQWLGPSLVHVSSNCVFKRFANTNVYSMLPLGAIYHRCTIERTEWVVLHLTAWVTILSILIASYLGLLLSTLRL
jgi:hypothetical protein